MTKGSAECQLPYFSKIYTFSYSCAIPQTGEFQANSRLLTHALGIRFQVFHKFSGIEAMGASSLKVAIGNVGAVKPHYSPYRQSERTNPKHAQLDSRLTWIQAYPSATSAWGSVFRNALNGKFDMALPLAHATLSFSGERLAGKFLVTKLHVSDIKPYEHPHPFACDLPVASRTLPAKKTRTVGAPLRQDSRITTPNGEYILTDAQWSLIEPLVTRVSQRTGKVRQVQIYPRKVLVEAILKRLGTPIAWTSLPGGQAFSKSVRATYVKFEKIGVWDEVLRRLQFQGCTGS